MTAPFGSGRQGALLAVSALLILVGAGFLLGADRDGGRGSDGVSEGGPLRVPNPHAWAVSKPVGEVFTDGLESLDLAGPDSAEIVDVQLVGSDPGLKLIGVGLVAPDRRFGSIQLMDGFPPRDPDLEQGDVISDGIGRTITPTSVDPIGWELLLGLKAVTPGRHVRDGIRIVYQVGSRTYARYWPAALAVCATTDPQPDSAECALPDL